jgi:hypothetical protein
MFQKKIEEKKHDLNKAYVRTQFSKDDVEASDSLFAGLLTMILTVMMEFWVDLTAK